MLISKKISPNFFIRHFGSRVLDYFIGILRGEKKPGQCPVIIVMLKFFVKSGFELDEIFQLCSGKRQALTHTLLEQNVSHNDKIYLIASELFDMNFSGVIKEYLSLRFGEKSTMFHDNGPSCTLSDIVVDNELIRDYFAPDEEENLGEKVLFRSDDADDIREYLNEISENLAFALVNNDTEIVANISLVFSKISTLLFHYTPYLDSLAFSMGELSGALLQNSEMFLLELKNSEHMMNRLFDAINSDIERYLDRFSRESMAMKNNHHIHEPTSISIRQIIAAFAPSEIEAGEIEFF